MAEGFLLRQISAMASECYTLAARRGEPLLQPSSGWVLVRHVVNHVAV